MQRLPSIEKTVLEIKTVNTTGIGNLNRIFEFGENENIGCGKNYVEVILSNVSNRKT